ncbi:MarR family winged helix-turn-helix transcriptional regulator [Streptomyces sp. NPDC048179]|uniref:MarR family winged helix-turn-helix transcriptional regulator n=1 Tax=Streptomyces sp. NPDC048179 TaxID=3365506 RepID=UPI0037203588
MLEDKTSDMDLARDLRLAVGRLARRLRRMFVDHGGGEGLTFLELGVLNRLAASGPASPGALAGGEGVTGAAVAAALTHLQGLGLVERSRDPEDGRRAIVTIADSGHRALDLRDAALLDGLRRVLREHLDDDDRARLAAALPLLEKVAAEL